MADGTALELQVNSLVDALVDANDQLLALYELTSITTDSLVEVGSIGLILSHARRLLTADALIVFTQSEHSMGSVADVEALRAARAGGTTTSDTHVASAVVTTPNGAVTELAALRKDRFFGTAETKLLRAVANLLAGAVHVAELHKEAVAQAIVARDHETASRLAQSALPTWRPEVPGVGLFARSDPARSAGGDLFTFAVIDEILHFAVGDVSGKGLPAALMMSTVISAANAVFQQPASRSATESLRAIDRWVFDYISEADLFVTLVVGSFCPSTRTLRVANAGHSPVFFVSGDKVATLPPLAPPVGVFPIEELLEWTTTVAAGDRFVIASDGFSEQLNVQEEMFGDDQLVELFRSPPDPASSPSQDATFQQLGDQAFDCLQAFAGPAAQGDDRTLFFLDFEEEDAQ